MVPTRTVAVLVVTELQCDTTRARLTLVSREKQSSTTSVSFRSSSLASLSSLMRNLSLVSAT